MSKEIFISSTPHETRLAIVETDELTEIYYERENEYTLAGSIYNGKVTRVLPGMQSSFVDIGLERDAFLYITDFMEEAGESAEFDAADGASGSRRGQRDDRGSSREDRGPREANGSARDEVNLDAPRLAEPSSDISSEPNEREGGRRRRGNRDGRGGNRDGRDSRPVADDRGSNRDRPSELRAPAPIPVEPAFDRPPVVHSGFVEPGAADAAELGEGAPGADGSRRWRGRRGRRRGRNSAQREESQVLQQQPGIPGQPSQLEPEAPAGRGYQADSETAEELEEDFDKEYTDIFDVQASSAGLAADPLSGAAEPPPSSQLGEGAREDRGARDSRESRDRGDRGRNRRDRGGRDRDQRAPRAPRGFAPSRALYGVESSEPEPQLTDGPVPEPLILPGESLSKYRKGDDQQSAANASGTAQTTVSAPRPSTEYVLPGTWDGSGVLPGETIRPRSNVGSDTAAPQRSGSDHYNESRGSRDRGGRDERRGGRDSRDDRFGGRRENRGGRDRQSSQAAPIAQAPFRNEAPLPHEAQPHEVHSQEAQPHEAQPHEAQPQELLTQHLQSKQDPGTAHQPASEPQVLFGTSSHPTPEQGIEKPSSAPVAQGEPAEYEPTEASASVRFDPTTRSEFRQAAPVIEPTETEPAETERTQAPAHAEPHAFVVPSIDAQQFLPGHATPQSTEHLPEHSPERFDRHPEQHTPEQHTPEQYNPELHAPEHATSHQTQPEAAHENQFHISDPAHVATAPAHADHDQDPAPEAAHSIAHTITPQPFVPIEPIHTEHLEHATPAHEFTTVGNTGEMTSDHPAPAAAEIEEPASPLQHETAVLGGTSQPESSIPGVSNTSHQQVEEEIFEEDEEEDFNATTLHASSIEEMDYEEEQTLEGAADLGTMIREMSIDQITRPATEPEEDDEILEEEDAVDDDLHESYDEPDAEEEDAHGFHESSEAGHPDHALHSEQGYGTDAPNGFNSSPSQSDTGRDPDRRSSRRDGGGRRDGRRDGRGRDRGGDRARSTGGSGDRSTSRPGRRDGRHSAQSTNLPAISDLLKPGQEVLVQIAKEPIAKKGARITSHIALPGRFLVFMPTVNHTGVSRKIESDAERRRLKEILLSEKGEASGGFIVRTAAANASEEELRSDLRFLLNLWADIKQRSESSKSPALIYHDLNLVERILRDQVTDTFSAIWVDTETEYERVLRFLQRFQPSLIRRVKLYTKETPLFEQFGITEEINKALRSKVWLKSGGSIVINQTEALVAIDINTGKYVGKTARLEDTIVKTNLDAIPEIVRQIRLRDLGGIIIIDFIDMDERKNRHKVMAALEDELKKDRAPSKVLQFNDFGLVAITRKRVKQSLERTLSSTCQVCQGTGMTKSPVTVCNDIYIEMRKMQKHLDRGDVMLRVNPEVVKQLKSPGTKWLQEMEDMVGRTILVKSDPSLHPEQFDIH